MITVKNLSYTYPGNARPTIKNISFEVKEGEILGFLGPSGAGKSTTQNILIKLLPGFAGEVEVMGKSLTSQGPEFYEHVGVGFELPNHYQKLSALENLRFFSSFYKRPARDPMELLTMVGLEDDARKKVEEFSKGMQMRLSFVRALIHDPEILFFDEPTSGLDPVNARIVKDIILDLKIKGKTIFLTTHNMHDADELCDRVAFIVDGEIALIDRPRHLKLIHGRPTIAVTYQNGSLQTQEFDLRNLGFNHEFLDLIKTESVESIHSQEATLEDIFITVTGRRLT